jgi:hypothetical protein
MQLGRIPVVVPMAFMCWPDLINAQDFVRDHERALMREIVRTNRFMDNGQWVALPEWLLPEEDFTDGGTGWRFRVSKTGFDRSVFGSNVNAADARRNLESILQHDVDVFTERYELTAVQWQKLHLAGKGDIERLFDRIEESRRRFQSYVLYDIAEIQELRQEFDRESNDLKIKIKTGGFRKGSLFAKTLKSILTAEQVAAYDTRKHDRPAAVTRSSDLRAR